MAQYDSNETRPVMASGKRKGFPSASRYDNGGCASNPRSSASDGISGTRDASSGSPSLGCGAGGALHGGGKTGGRSSVMATSSSCVDCLGVEAAVSFLPTPGRLLALDDGWASRACRAR
ncbi:hypothetical protein E5D57_010644 [Metarhizium anisopliae]|nr:hypothetical protein E5D57_010644 [Metarhizium anisopliae]